MCMLYLTVSLTDDIMYVCSYCEVNGCNSDKAGNTLIISVIICTCDTSFELVGRLISLGRFTWLLSLACLIGQSFCIHGYLVLSALLANHSVYMVT